MSLVSKVGHFPLPLAIPSQGKLSKCWFVNLATQWRRVVNERHSVRSLNRCLDVRSGGLVEQVWYPISCRKNGLPMACAPSYCGDDENKQFVWLGDSNFKLVGSIWFAAPGPGISILHQVAVDALAARVVWVESGKQLKPGWKGNKNWQIFPGDVMSTFLDIIKSNKTTKHVWLSSFTWLKQQFLGGTCYLEDYNHLPNIFHHHVHSRSVPRTAATSKATKMEPSNRLTAGEIWQSTHGMKPR